MEVCSAFYPELDAVLTPLTHFSMTIEVATRTHKFIISHQNHSQVRCSETLPPA